MRRPELGRHARRRAAEDATLSAWAFVHGLSNLLLDGQIPPALRAGRSDGELAKAVIAAMAHGLGYPAK